MTSLAAWVWIEATSWVGGVEQALSANVITIPKMAIVYNFLLVDLFMFYLLVYPNLFFASFLRETKQFAESNFIFAASAYGELLKLGYLLQ
jgi:hypothetical protein